MKREYLRKLKRMAEDHGLRELARKTALSRQSLYNLFRHNDFKMSTLESVTEKLGYTLVVQVTPPAELDKKTLHSALRKLGAPFYENDPVSFSPEDTLLKALEHSLTDPQVADALPIFFHKTQKHSIPFHY